MVLLISSNSTNLKKHIHKLALSVKDDYYGTCAFHMMTSTAPDGSKVPRRKVEENQCQNGAYPAFLSNGADINSCQCVRVKLQPYNPFAPMPANSCKLTVVSSSELGEDLTVNTPPPSTTTTETANAQEWNVFMSSCIYPIEASSGGGCECVPVDPGTCISTTVTSASNDTYTLVTHNMCKKGSFPSFPHSGRDSVLAGGHLPMKTGKCGCTYKHLRTGQHRLPVPPKTCSGESIHIYYDSDYIFPDETDMGKNEARHWYVFSAGCSNPIVKNTDATCACL